MREGRSIDELRRIYGGAAHRYDWQHGLVTGWADQRGRRLLVAHAIRPGDNVLDCGAGTGSTALLAARAVGPEGHVTLFDLSEPMLEVARQRFAAASLESRADFVAGDMVRLPFEADTFDTTLSTYSLCSIYDPAAAATELLRVTRANGRIGIAHSTEPKGAVARRIGEWIENFAWRLPWLSLGCRAISVLPHLQAAGARLVLEKRIGVPLWPFLVFVVEKP